MFYWYQKAVKYYVYLSDISVHDSTGDPGSKWEGAFSKNRWFKRGWMLQELIVPTIVSFFSKENRLLGDKKELVSTISAVTRIPSSALIAGLELSYFSENERLSWANGRTTTVPKDAAYCLVGILDVELHMLYADGDYHKRKDAAEKKLHKAIGEKNSDIEGSQDVVRIGGASWNELIKLSAKDLRGLDSDLNEYQKWLLEDFPKQHKERAGSASVLTVLSETAGRRMKALLAKYSVRCEDLSHLKANVRSCDKPWARYLDESATAQARVQGLVENRWFWTKKTRTSSQASLQLEHSKI